MAKKTSTDPLAIHMLHDRVLVTMVSETERTSEGGIVIPATAKMGHRLAWADVVAVGPNVRSVKAGDRVLFNPVEAPEVELHSAVYVLMRERDLHAVATREIDESTPGLYL